MSGDTERFEFFSILLDRLLPEQFDAFMSNWGIDPHCTPEMHDLYLATKEN